MKTLMLGCDPEVFLLNKETGSVVPSCGLIGGEKGKPLKISDTTSILEDNVTVELNVAPVEFEPFNHAFHNLVANAVVSAEEYINNKLGHQFSFYMKSVIKFKSGDLTHPKSLIFGCSPDFDAYRFGEQCELNTGLDPCKRYAGGHLHFGYKSTIPEWAIVQFIEGLILVRWIRQAGGELIGTDRVRAYGRPGAFRPTSYGLEWRTPSNAWLANSRYDLFLDQVHYLVWWLINNEHRAQQLYDRIDFRSVRHNLMGCTASQVIHGHAENLLYEYMPEMFEDRGEARLDQPNQPRPLPVTLEHLFQQAEIQQNFVREMGELNNGQAA